jgi:hypothetical protein
MMKTWKTMSAAVAVVALTGLSSLPFSAAAEEATLEQMIATAKTPADHEAIAALYRGESAKLQKEATQHAAIAEQFTREAAGQAPWAGHHYEWANHCRAFADSLGKAAQEAQALAKIHESMAQSAVEDKR